MSPQLLLYLTDDGLQAWSWRAGRLCPLASFARDEAGQSEFSAFLARHRRQKLLMLSDLASEMHLSISIPACRGRDRQQVLSRQLARHFPTCSLNLAISLGSLAPPAKQEQVLLHGFSSNAAFAPWLDELSRQESWLAGIYSVTQLAPPLLQKAGIVTPQCLLFTHQAGRLRQCQVTNEQTRYSRVVTLTQENPAQHAQDLLDEVEKMQRYLASQDNWSRTAEHSILIIGDSPVSALLVTEQAAERGLMQVQAVDSQTLAEQLGLHEFPPGAGTAALFLHLLANSPPPQQFADEPRLRNWHAQQQLRRLGAAALLVTCASSLLALPMHLEAQALNTESQRLIATAQQLEQEQARLQQTHSLPEIAPSDLLQLHQTYLELRRQAANPDAAYRLIAAALDQHPEVQLSRLDWEIAPLSPSTAAAGQPLQEITIAQFNFAVDLLESTKTTSIPAFIATLQRDAQFTITQAATLPPQGLGFKLEIRRRLGS